MRKLAKERLENVKARLPLCNWVVSGIGTKYVCDELVITICAGMIFCPSHGCIRKHDIWQIIVAKAWADARDEVESDMEKAIVKMLYEETKNKVVKFYC